MSLMKVEDALAQLLDDIPLSKTEWVPLSQAAGRILAEDLAADRNQPPFDASAMDGYAVKAANLKDIPAKLQVVGEVPAGHHFPDALHNWEAVRIFTGAPVPQGADAILIQENTERDGAFVTALSGVKEGQYIRKAGLDFAKGDVLIKQGTKLNPRHVALAAAMNHAKIPVLARPKVAILATGDELVLPGQKPNDDQIISSNSYGVASLAHAIGAEILDLGIAADRNEDIAQKVEQAKEWQADILVTSGGASVGDHDLVQDVLKQQGMDLGFWRIAMRPGKPLMAGKLDDMQVLGLPGNPVSAIICSILFLLPLIRHRLGDTNPQPILQAKIGNPIAENDKRQSYLRASLSQSENGERIATAFSGQDSAMLSGLTKADCLLIRPPFAPEAKEGDNCQIILL